MGRYQSPLLSFSLYVANFCQCSVKTDPGIHHRQRSSVTISDQIFSQIVGTMSAAFRSPLHYISFHHYHARFGGLVGSHLVHLPRTSR